MTNLSPGLSLATSTSAAETTLSVTGEIDLETAPQLRDALMAVVTTAQSQVLIDLSGVSFMDSTGLHTLMAAKRRADISGVELAVTHPSHVVERLLEVTGLTTAFQPQAGSASPAPA